MNDATRDLMFSSATNGGTDDWETPPDLFAKLNAHFHFTLDPAASASNALCRHYFTQSVDGLKQSWAGYTVFVNPPYSNAKAWAKKACEEYILHGVTIVMLLPARTDTIMYHEYVQGKARVHFLRGRLRFQENGKPKLDKKTGKPVGAPFPSMLVLFQKDPFDGI